MLRTIGWNAHGTQGRRPRVRQSGGPLPTIRRATTMMAGDALRCKRLPSAQSRMRFHLVVQRRHRRNHLQRRICDDQRDLSPTQVGLGRPNQFARTHELAKHAKPGSSADATPPKLAISLHDKEQNRRNQRITDPAKPIMLNGRSTLQHDFG